MTIRSATFLGSLLLAGTLAACGGGAAAPSTAASVAASKPAASAAASAKPAASAAASAKPAGSAAASAKPAASGSAAAKPAPSIVPATKAATVKITANATQGNILSDSDGKTLYTFDVLDSAASKDPSKCTGACLGAWPPFLSTTAPAAPSGLTGTLTLIARTDINPGVQQVAYNGNPLYYFVQDQAPGDAKGQNSKGFNGNWQVIKAGGSSAAAGGASAAASKPAAG